ncbi:efflux system outer membrane component [Bordetella ansorpii]|uniref:Efflux system outer membrane component n=1 Tax=Bordetella ansorpii TaxID=288768 RepID=A0A157SPC1_9BORD|nr:efflux system outer membrane component [Bordetella ansorpii]
MMARSMTRPQLAKSARGVLATALVAALAGCSLAPDYKRPDAPVQATYPDQPKVQFGDYQTKASVNSQPAAAVAPAGAYAAADIGWREFFRDPRLQKLIELSLANSRDLRVAVQRVEEARAQYGVQRASQWPSIGAGVQGTRQRLPANMRQGGPDSPSISSQYQAGLGLTSFEIDLFGRLRNLSEAAYQQYLSTEQSQRSVHITLVGAVAEAYFNLRAADVQLDLTQQTLASRQQSYDLVKTRFDGGVASELDLNQSKSLLDTASANLAQLARTRAQAQNALVVLTGLPSLPADLPAPLEFGRDQLVASVPSGLPSDLLERRPDILAAENQLKAANANIGAARAAFFPTISLTGLLGSTSSSLGDLFKGGQGFWSFSPSIQTPIFAGGSVREGLNLARARAIISPCRNTSRRSSRHSARSPTRWPEKPPTMPSSTPSAPFRCRRRVRWNCRTCAIVAASTASCRCRPRRWISSTRSSRWCRPGWIPWSTASSCTRRWAAAGMKRP